VVRPPTNWKAVSGWVLFLGIALIGLAFLSYAFALASSDYGVAVGEIFLSLLGLGIIVIGLSFAFARMA
jgi:membrane-associated HD superfamily phosphohydrolase